METKIKSYGLSLISGVLYYIEIDDPKEFTEASSQSSEVLKGGRNEVIVFQYRGKSYIRRDSLRGGIWSKFPFKYINTKHYLGFGTSPFRQEQEFNNHLYLFENGVSTPRPVAYLIKEISLKKILNLSFYSGSFFSEYIKNSKTLASALDSLKSEEISIATKKVASEVEKMLDLGVYHVDLHPNNVLVDSELHVYIIDFDGSKRFDPSTDREFYKQKIISRWKRAVEKYGLSCSMTREFEDSLKK